MIVHDPLAKKLKLREQSALLQDVLHSAIDQATADVILVTNWPEENTRLVYGKRLLLTAARDDAVIGDYDQDQVQNLKHVIKEDVHATQLMVNLVSYTSLLGFQSNAISGFHCQVIDRLSLVRAPAKKEAAAALPYYHLGLDSDCKERVQSLTERLSFHMPGVWGGRNGNVRLFNSLAYP